MITYSLTITDRLGTSCQSRIRAACAFDAVQSVQPAMVTAVRVADTDQQPTSPRYGHRALWCW